MKYLSSLISSIFYTTIAIPSSFAQVTVDGTTPTTITPTKKGVQINKGNSAGSNLFHSFNEFSIPTGSEAHFNNNNDVVNIFSRVTGGNISNINGLIRANGSANLFLINPAGIIFGEGARLQLGGSFYGSTADSIVFSDGEFSAADLDNSPLITVNAPIGLNFRDSSTDIINRSVANDEGLSISADKTIALIGGDISFEGGQITTAGGNIELASIADNGLVTLENTETNFNFKYDEIASFGNIELKQNAVLDTSGNSPGSIKLQGDLISLINNSRITSQNTGLRSAKDILVQGNRLTIEDNSRIITTTIADGNAANINLNITDSIQILGTRFEEFENNFLVANIKQIFDFNSLEKGTGIITGTNGTGTGGKITLNTTTLSLQQGSVIGGFVFAEGDSGELIIDATNSVNIDSSGIINGLVFNSSGDGVLSEVKTNNLTLINNGIITSITLGSGNGGNISINAKEEINLRQTLSNSNSVSSTGIFSNSFFNEGEAGDISLTTKKLNIQDGGQIVSASGALIGGNEIIDRGGKGGNINIEAIDSITLSGSSLDGKFPSTITSSTLTNSDAGNIDIQTSNLFISNNAHITTATVNSGQAGNLTINAPESIKIIGSNNRFSSFISSASGETILGTFFDPSLATGSAGNLSIETKILSISNRGRVSVSSIGSGNTGNLDIVADNIQLNHGNINAATQAGSGGKITLNATEDITLQNNSLISAEAINKANGGNLNINAKLIIAYPSRVETNGSDILASSPQGQGGKIRIDAESLFGIQKSKNITNNGTNDINASSNIEGLDGSISIETPDINFLPNTSKLSDHIIYTEILTASNSCYGLEKEDASSLIFKGKGERLVQPIEPFTNDSLIIDNKLDTLQISQVDRLNNNQNRNNINTQSNNISSKVKPVAYQDNGEPIYLARGIIKQEDGSVILTARAVDDTKERTLDNSYYCN